MTIQNRYIPKYIEKNYPEYYSIERYPADKTAAFCKVDAPWGTKLSGDGKVSLRSGIPIWLN